MLIIDASPNFFCHMFITLSLNNNDYKDFLFLIISTVSTKFWKAAKLIGRISKIEFQQTLEKKNTIFIWEWRLKRIHVSIVLIREKISYILNNFRNYRKFLSFSSLSPLPSPPPKKDTKILVSYSCLWWLKILI